MVISNPSISPISYVILCEQVLHIHFPLGSISRSPFSRSPILGQMKPIVRFSNPANGLIQFLFSDVMLIDPRQITTFDSGQCPCSLRWTEVTAITKSEDNISGNGIGEFGGMPRVWAKEAGPIEPLLGLGEDIKDRDGFQAFCEELLENGESLWLFLLFHWAQDEFPFFKAQMLVRRKCIVCLFDPRMEPVAHVFHKCLCIGGQSN